MRPARSSPAAVMLAAMTACAPVDRAPAGHLSAAWKGAETTSVSFPARAAWCGEERFLELWATQGDSGIGLVIYPADSLIAGEYPAFDPAGGRPQRPGAAAAVRWFSEHAMEGWQSDSGTVDLEMGPREVSGRFGLHLRSAGSLGPVDLTGSFSRVPLGPSPARCPGDTITADADSGDRVTAIPDSSVS